MGKGGVIALIRWYQQRISPLFPPSCRFLPTCSDYAMEAVERYGMWKGGWLFLKRFSKCHPFYPQKSICYDPVPKKGEGKRKHR